MRSRDARGKQKASSPTDVPPAELDGAAVRQPRRASGERRSKANPDPRRVHTSKAREVSRHGSPPPKRGRTIEVSTSEEAASESEHSDREQSSRYSSLWTLFFSLECYCTCLRRHYTRC